MTRHARDAVPAMPLNRGDVPAGVWRTTVARVAKRIVADDLTSLAAASAFYALLSVFPVITAVVSVYGLAADRAMVERQVIMLGGILPPDALSLLTAWLQTLVAGPPSRFGTALFLSVLLAFWSAWSATSMLMSGVNTCYGEAETRGFLRFNRDAAVLTAGLAFFGFTALCLMAILPAVLELLPLPGTSRQTITVLRWPMLICFAMLALAIVYRYAPARIDQEWRWLTWGALVATLLWLVGSFIFTTYVAAVGSYDKTYGSLGAVIVLLLWFYWTAFVILVGAEINAECERRA